MVTGRPFITFRPATPVADVVRGVSDSDWQDAFPVIDDKGKICGVISSEIMRVLAGAKDLGQWSIAADIMQPAVTVTLENDLRTAAQLMILHNVRELVVTDAGGKILGFLDEADIAKAYLAATSAKA
jgi:CIC family chloride channel protein